MENREPQSIPISSIRVEDGARELVLSERMQPYLALLKAQISGHDATPFLEALAALPLEDRYVWRVMSALKWAFCDLETESVIADLRTLAEEDVEKLTERLRFRTLQYCIFVCAVLGKTPGERLILQSLDTARASFASESGE